jgi:hypothetical protein
MYNPWKSLLKGLSAFIDINVVALIGFLVDFFYPQAIAYLQSHLLLGGLGSAVLLGALRAGRNWWKNHDRK